MTPSLDPARPARRSAAPGPRVLALAGALCAAAGAGGAVLITRLVDAPATAPAPARTASEPEAPALLAPPPPAAATAADADLERISARLDHLEDAQARTAAAAARALAAAALAEAAQSSRPFVEELSSAAAVSPPSPDLRALRRLAETGVPSRMALAQEYLDFAARAAAAARSPGDRSGPLAWLGAAFARVILIRRVGEGQGSGADAVLSQAERQVMDGDIDRALRTLDALPAPARDALAPWRSRAERRAEVDRRLGALRSQALDDLARRGGS